MKSCFKLTTVIIGAGVASIGQDALLNPSDLTAVYLEGNAPIADSPGFNHNATVYYFPGATGWSANLVALPTVLSNSQTQAIGVRTNLFRFSVTGTSKNGNSASHQ